MKIVYLYDKFGSHGAIPNGARMSVEEFIGHYTKTSPERGFQHFVKDEIAKLTGMESLEIHHSEAVTNLDFYLQQGPLIYNITFDHDMSFQNVFEFPNGRESWVDYIPENIKKLFIKKKCNIVLTIRWSDCTIARLQKIFRSIILNFKTLDNFYICFSNIMLEYQLKELSSEERQHLIYYPYSEMFTLKKLAPYQEQSMAKDKKFISLNRRYNPGRVKLHIELEKRNLNQHGFVSMPEFDVATEKSLKDWTSINLPDLNSSLLDHAKYYTLDQEPVSYANGKIPKSFLGFPKNQNLSDYFNRSYFSIVTESRTLGNHEGGVMITEKTYRAISHKHPFILVSKHRSLEALKSLGFKTFDSVWDESYDTIVDDDQRFNAIADLVESLCNRNLDEVLEACRPVIEYNLNHLEALCDNFKSRIENIIL
jgi:hypothetical protein